MHAEAVRQRFARTAELIAEREERTREALRERLRRFAAETAGLDDRALHAAWLAR
jgi:hypothetical protein